jgi:hypothetical protein
MLIAEANKVNPAARYAPGDFFDSPFLGQDSVVGKID